MRERGRGRKGDGRMEGVGDKGGEEQRKGWERGMRNGMRERGRKDIYFLEEKLPKLNQLF